MDKITSDRVRELCSLIQVEQDAGKFLELIQELNRLLDEKGASSPQGPYQSIALPDRSKVTEGR